MASIQDLLIDALYDLPKDQSWDEVMMAVRKRWATQDHLSTRFVNEFRRPNDTLMTTPVLLQKLSSRAQGMYLSEHSERLLQEQFTRGREMQSATRSQLLSS